MHRVRLRAWIAILGFMAVPRLLVAQMAPIPHFEQWRPAGFPPAARMAPVDSAAPTANGSGMILGGIAGVAVGYAAGGLLGTLVACTDTSSDEGYCELGAFVLGGFIASTFTIPMGVHLGNHERGDLSRDILVSAAMGAAGLGVAAATESGAVFLVTPLAQVLLSIWMEERSMHKTPPPDASH